MGRLAGFSYPEVARRLRRLGFQFDRQAKGSHEIWRHARDGRKTTVPRHPGDIAEATLRAVLRQAGVTPAVFLDA
jgi:predicted RNA binding protein YcfA (HicA-like mRNA interferase family)